MYKIIDKKGIRGTNAKGVQINLMFGQEINSRIIHRGYVSQKALDNLISLGRIEKIIPDIENKKDVIPTNKKGKRYVNKSI
jgi:hypothetical protein